MGDWRDLRRDGDEELDSRPSISFRAAAPVTSDVAAPRVAATKKAGSRKKSALAEPAALPLPVIVLPPGMPDLDRSRPGIVHRLDKGTSGLMVVARHPRAREHLKEQFAAHTIEREYVALTVGAVQKQTFETLHGRHPTDRLRFSSRVKAGKRAVTHVTPLERFGLVATQVACRLETGRTHQIRVHLADHQTPILGDPLYGKIPKHDVLRAVALMLGRPALHARVLGFVHPITREKMRFEVDPPADFQLALAMLRAIP